jgi:hypothetical protein
MDPSYFYILIGTGIYPHKVSSGYLTCSMENGAFIDDKHDDLPKKSCDFP